MPALISQLSVSQSSLMHVGESSQKLRVTAPDSLILVPGEDTPFPADGSDHFLQSGSEFSFWPSSRTDKRLPSQVHGPGWQSRAAEVTSAPWEESSDPISVQALDVGSSEEAG